MTNPSFTLPWGAWLQEEERTYALPSNWTVDVAAVAGADTARSGPGLTSALAEPIQSPSLGELARGKSTAAIAVEDITRPAAAGPVLEAVLGELEAAGIPASNVRVIFALGGHGPMHRHEMMLKVGESVMNRCDVSNHHPYENLVDLGVSKRGIPIHINRYFHEAELKLAVGSIVPHPYAGFGGGGKIVLPGVAGIETLYTNHRPAVTGLSGAGLGVVEGNTARAEMEEIALAAGLAAVVNIVPGARREPLGHFFGHPVAAHRAAVEFARTVFGTQVNPGADAVVLNAYPKDGEVLQVGNAFNAYRACTPPLVREGGTIIVSAACPLGRGYHSLHGPGGRLYRDPVRREYLGDRELVVFAPDVSTHDVRKSFWHGYPHARDWNEVTTILEERHPSGGRMIVIPTAPLAIPRPVPTSGASPTHAQE